MSMPQNREKRISEYVIRRMHLMKMIIVPWSMKVVRFTQMRKKNKVHRDDFFFFFF